MHQGRVVGSHVRIRLAWFRAEIAAKYADVATHRLEPQRLLIFSILHKALGSHPVSAAGQAA